MSRAAAREITDASTPVYTVEAFATTAFGGNPAAVCLLEEPRTERWMQQVATEMNLFETAFVERRDGVFALRWFTPRTEIRLCGHATLASAHVLWETGRLDVETPHSASVPCTSAKRRSATSRTTTC